MTTQRDKLVADKKKSSTKRASGDQVAARLRLLADRLYSVASEIEEGISDDGYRAQVEALAELGYATTSGALTFEIVEEVLDAAAQRLRIDAAPASEVTSWARQLLADRLVLSASRRLMPQLTDARLGEAIEIVAKRRGKWGAVAKVARHLGVRGDDANLKRHLLRSRAKRGDIRGHCRVSLSRRKHFSTDKRSTRGGGGWSWTRSRARSSAATSTTTMTTMMTTMMTTTSVFRALAPSWRARTELARSAPNTIVLPLIARRRADLVCRTRLA